MKKTVWSVCLLGLLWSGAASSAPLTLNDAVQRALQHDPRIAERQKLVDAARAIIDEALGHRGLMIGANAFIGMTTAKQGNIFEPGTNNVLRHDAYDIDGVSDWEMLQFQIIKPLYTFGKIENYARAAQGQADVKRGDLRIQRGQTMLDVKRAYYGYLTARDVRQMLEDVEKRLLSAQNVVKQGLSSGDANATQADLFQLEAGEAQLRKFILQARAVEDTAAQGLRMLTGLPDQAPLELADSHIMPVGSSLADKDSLAQLQKLALQSRPESAQIEAGLRARRALVAAKRSDAYPDIYAGIVGVVSYASQREDQKNPFLYDPFHQYGVTPVLGMRWNWQGSVNSAQVANAQAELDALDAKSSFAQQGIPFQVAEAYNTYKALGETVTALDKGSSASQRWMIASYADFEAGVGEGEKVMRALQSYALNRADYLRAVNDYNMAAANLDVVTGQYR